MTTQASPPIRNDPPPTLAPLADWPVPPDSNSCRTVVWKRDRFPHGCTWPREDGPLGQTTFLGRLLFNNKGNRAKLSEILKNFGEYAAFSDQASALKAGSDLLKKQNESQYLQIAGQPHSVLVYVTKRGDWRSGGTTTRS
nr:uncharacterized protein LOC113811060 [Penaeus vannamei]